ncbi:lymphocyte antigen 6D [Sphaeramia orbicularis]|uniref:lymphocyte antigen 6D n=1 Tax=Sphaeramia orbicularis TaxID=375764 RepID=UPI0011808ED0|nr:lymphocyte antigen 6D [Sphaeramia orbicularis]
MKPQLLTVMFLLLQCSTFVLSLRCYTCESDPQCKTETECDSSAQYCKTVYQDDNLVRTCEEFCEVGIYTDCCETDLC